MLPLEYVSAKALPPQEAKPPTPNPSEDTHIYWTHLYQEAFCNGAAIFQHKGRTYSMKPMFGKGRYDEQAKTYISRPVIYFMDVSDVNTSAAPLVAIFEFADGVDAAKDLPTGGKVRIRTENSTIKILSEGGGTPSLIYSITYSGILKLWANNAENYKRPLYGETVYLVPQFIRAKDSVPQAGFVVSKNKPLSVAGYPQDFIALFSLNNGMTVRRMRYSIPLGLKFRYVGDTNSTADKVFFHWQAEEMDNSELYDALDDEAAEAALVP